MINPSANVAVAEDLHDFTKRCRFFSAIAFLEMWAMVSTQQKHEKETT